MHYTYFYTFYTHVCVYIKGNGNDKTEDTDIECKPERYVRPVEISEGKSSDDETHKLSHDKVQEYLCFNK